MSTVLDLLKYTESHEWVRVEGSSGRIGITDHAQAELTDIVFVELPEVGKVVKTGDAVAVVESVKVAADIYAPVSGKIVAVNQKLEDQPELINTDPYGEGWIFELEMSDGGENLLDAAAYSESVK